MTIFHINLRMTVVVMVRPVLTVWIQMSTTINTNGSMTTIIQTANTIQS